MYAGSCIDHSLHASAEHSLALKISLIITAVTILYCACKWTSHTYYVLHRHPLHKVPGPKLPLLCPLVVGIYDSFTGRGPHRSIKWHQRYGEVVRSGADTLSFTSPAAWKDIYGRRGPDELSKSRPKGLKLGPPDILEASTKDHRRLRRLMGPAFSKTAVQEQEPVVRKYVELLLVRLGNAADRSTPVDLTRAFNHLTFDIIGDLAFGVSLGGLADGRTNPWIENIHKTVRFFPVIALISGMSSFLRKPVLKRIRQAQLEHRQHVQKLLAERLQKSDHRSSIDFVDMFTRAKISDRHEGGDMGIQHEELVRNLDTLMVAGSETVATLLAGVFYLLMTNEYCLERCTLEVRQAFGAGKLPDMGTAAQLPYLRACLQETLRLYPPVPTTLGRQTPSDRVVAVAGCMVPPGTKVGIPPLAAYRSSANWHRPNDFCPERWLSEALHEDSSFFHDKRDVHKPFSFGPRDCIGSNLAWGEASSVLASVLREFDLDLCATSRGWLEDQKVFGLWQKPPLWVSLTRRTSDREHAMLSQNTVTDEP